jgi:hypothetical protein
VVGKQLSALLQILRSNGVTRYVSGELTLELGPAPRPRAAPIAVNLSPEALDAERREEEDDEEEGDPRFLLERLTRRHFPIAKADPRRNKAPQ